jgi:hypothetical protein
LGKSGIGGDVDLDDSATIEFYIDYDSDQNGNADFGNEWQIKPILSVLPQGILLQTLHLNLQRHA